MVAYKLLVLGACVFLPACASNPPAGPADRPRTGGDAQGVMETQGEAQPHTDLAELEEIDDDLTNLALRLVVATPPDVAKQELQRQIAVLKLRVVALEDQLQTTKEMANAVNVRQVRREVEHASAVLDIDIMRLTEAVDLTTRP
jgi:hypothetical protein